MRIVDKAVSVQWCDECLANATPDLVIVKFFDAHMCENCIQEAVNLIREHYELADDE